jgi:thymidine kinase
MFSLLTWKTKLAAVGAALLSIAALLLRLKIVKYQRDKAEVVAETLKARLHQQKVQKKIAKEEKEKLVSRTADLVNELNKPKEEFKGVDNFNKPNDF